MEKDSTSDAVVILKFQSAVALKDAKTCSELLAKDCTMIIPNKNIIYHGREKIIAAYRQHWFNIPSNMQIFTVSLTNQDGSYVYELDAHFKMEINGCDSYVNRFSETKFIIRNKLIAGIVRTSNE